MIQIEHDGYYKEIISIVHARKREANEEEETRAKNVGLVNKSGRGMRAEEK